VRIDTGARSVPESAETQRIVGDGDVHFHAGGGGRAEVAHADIHRLRHARLGNCGRVQELQFDIGLSRFHVDRGRVFRERPHRGLVEARDPDRARGIADTARGVSSLPNEVLPWLQGRQAHERVQEGGYERATGAGHGGVVSEFEIRRDRFHERQARNTVRPFIANFGYKRHEIADGRARPKGRLPDGNAR